MLKQALIGCEGDQPFKYVVNMHNESKNYLSQRAQLILKQIVGIRYIMESNKGVNTRGAHMHIIRR